MKMRTAVTAMAIGFAAGGAQAQSNEELKVKLDQALKTIQDLQSRVNALEQHKTGTDAAAAAAPGTWGAPVVSVGTRAEDGAPEPEKARVEFYGQAMVDAIQDFRRMNPQWAATERPSQIPVNCPGDPGCGKDGATTFSVRQSSLGFRAFIPTGLGLLKTDLSFDLFASDGSTNIHWLSAWAEIGMFGIGQTYSNFMDIDVFPNTIDYWGPSGMVFVRNPQLRVTPWSKDGMSLAFALESPNSALDTGKISDISPDFGAGFVGWNRLPDLTAAWRMDGDWGHVKVAGLLRQVGYQNTLTPDNNPSGHKTGYGLNLTAGFKVFRQDQINLQLAAGEAIASYMNDGGVDLAPGQGLHAETVPTLGWLAYYNHVWADKWTSTIGFSQHQQNNTDGQTGTAFHRGSYGNVNVLYTPAKNVLTGLEFVYGELVQKSGDSAPDYRLQFSTKVTF